MILDCGKFPPIDNGEKVLLESVVKNSTYSIEVSVEYNCNEGFIWSLDTPLIVSCLVDGLDYEVGRCVKGRFCIMLMYVKSLYQLVGRLICYKDMV